MVTLEPILDTHFTPNTSYGSATAVQVRGSTGHKGFIKFNFSTIPANSTIVGANLKIKVTGVSTGSFKLYKVLKDWDETATWTLTKSTGGTSWGTAGAGPGTDYDVTSIVGHLYRPDAKGTVNIPLSADGVNLIQNHYAGTIPNYGIVLVDDSATNTDAVSFASSEATAADRPKLEISYTLNMSSTFKVAFWNLEAGTGMPKMAGKTCAYDDSGYNKYPNCTGAAIQPGHILSDQLASLAASNANLVAIGLSEAYGCVSAATVRTRLGWPAPISGYAGVVTGSNGTSVVAKYGIVNSTKGAVITTDPNNAAYTCSDPQTPLRTEICLDAICSKTMQMFTAHMAHCIYDIQAQNLMNFVNGEITRLGLPANHPRIVGGDFNIWAADYESSGATASYCAPNAGGSPDANRPCGFLYQKAYDVFKVKNGMTDAWRYLYPDFNASSTSRGYTAMLNRSKCSYSADGAGSGYKRIDHIFSKYTAPIAVSHVGKPAAYGDCVASEHMAVMGEFMMP